MKPPSKIWTMLRTRKSGIGMTSKFLMVYVLLGVIPIVAFIGWYSNNLVQEQQRGQTYEKQTLLKQSAQLLENQLQRSALVQSILQSNTAFIDLLTGSYSSASKELFAYDQQIKPVFTSILASEPMVDAVFIYRFMDSALSQSELVYYLMGIDEFPYNPSLLEELKTANTARTLVVDGAEKSVSSPRLMHFMNLYNHSYSKVVGVLEVQINMNKIVQHLDFARAGELLYLKWNDLYYPIVPAGAKLGLGAGQAEAQAVVGQSAPPMLAVSIPNWDMELVYAYGFDSSIFRSTVYSVLLTILFLLLPSFFFWLYINHFASGLQRFSQHIRSSRKAELVPYCVKQSKDEFGLVVSEYNRLINKVHALIDSVRQAEKLKSDASYYAMASQINPHFMFNTLENIRMHIEVDDAEGASNMLFILSRFLRYNISMRQNSTLLDELEHIRNYLLIYQYRQKKKIEFQIDVPPLFENLSCPFCILQPVVENCVKHGMQPHGCLSIHIAVRQDDSATLVEILDNGSGIKEETMLALNTRLNSLLQEIPLTEPEPDGTGSVGLANVNGRLKYYYGPACGISFRANSPAGAVCALRLGSPSENKPPKQPERI